MQFPPVTLVLHSFPKLHCDEADLANRAMLSSNTLPRKRRKPQSKPSMGPSSLIRLSPSTLLSSGRRPKGKMASEGLLVLSVEAREVGVEVQEPTIRTRRMKSK